MKSQSSFDTSHRDGLGFSARVLFFVVSVNLNPLGPLQLLLCVSDARGHSQVKK